MDNLVIQALACEQDRTRRRLTAAIQDVSYQLDRIQDAILSGKPLTAGRARQLAHLAGDVALAAGAYDVLVEWGEIISPVPPGGVTSDVEICEGRR